MIVRITRSSNYDEDRGVGIMTSDCYSTASLWSKLSLSFVSSFMKRAFSSTVHLSDVPVLPPRHLVHSAYASVWQHASPKLVVVLFRTVKTDFVAAVCLATLWSAMFVLTPSFLFPGLISNLQDPTQHGT